MLYPGQDPLRQSSMELPATWMAAFPAGVSAGIVNGWLNDPSDLAAVVTGCPTGSWSSIMDFPEFMAP